MSDLVWDFFAALGYLVVIAVGIVFTALTICGILVAMTWKRDD